MQCSFISNSKNPGATLAQLMMLSPDRNLRMRHHQTYALRQAPKTILHAQNCFGGPFVVVPVMRGVSDLVHKAIEAHYKTEEYGHICKRRARDVYLGLQTQEGDLFLLPTLPSSLPLYRLGEWQLVWIVLIEGSVVPHQVSVDTDITVLQAHDRAHLSPVAAERLGWFEHTLTELTKGIDHQLCYTDANGFDR